MNETYWNYCKLITLQNMLNYTLYTDKHTNLNSFITLKKVGKSFSDWTLTSCMFKDAKIPHTNVI